MTSEHTLYTVIEKQMTRELMRRREGWGDKERKHTKGETGIEGEETEKKEEDRKGNCKSRSEIDKRLQRKKSSETVKCRENRAMNYSVVILSDSSL